jgi:glycosyltransferase involved in cell wall biosynthesis/Tfp pilus assembly protein PilF
MNAGCDCGSSCRGSCRAARSVEPPAAPASRPADVLKRALDRCGWTAKLPLYEPVLKNAQVIRAMHQPAITVVMITNNFTAEVRNHLRMLAAERSLNYELVLVDNGAGMDGVGDLASDIDVAITLTHDTGAYLARNIGAAFAQAPILLFLEDDGEPAGDLIRSHLEAFEQYDVISVRGVYLPKTPTPLNRWARHYWLGDKPFPFLVNLEGNASYLASAFYAVGGWDDEIVFGHGGPELALRLIQHEPDRRKQIYSPAPVIRHDYARSEEHLRKKWARQEQSQQRLREKHPDFDAFVRSWSAFRGRADLLIPRKPATEPVRPVDPAQPGPLVTIAIPTYNRAKLVTDAVQSALAQTYPNFEIVVVDDGSTDETAAVMGRITDPRVRFVPKEHEGGPATRNRCIAEARGEFLLWLDSDDVLLPNTLALYVAAQRQDPDVDVFYGNLLAADERLRVQDIWIYTDYYGWRDKLLSDLIIENRIPNVAVLVRKSCYDKVGGYNPAFPRAHDYEFWTRLAPVATMKSIQADTAIYRRHEESLSKLRGQADTSYEATAAKAMLARHELRALFPFCYAAGAPVEKGNARAWLIASLIVARYDDLTGAVEFAQRSVDCADLGLNARVLEILQAATGGAHPRPSVRTEPPDGVSRLIAVATKQLAAGRVRECARACSQLTELRPEAPETLLLAALSLRRWGKPQEATTAFQSLVKRQCEQAYLEAVTEAEAIRRKQPEIGPGSATPAEQLTALLSPYFGGERIPPQAIEDTLAFIASAAATDAPRRQATHREKQTPLFYAMLGLTADELDRCLAPAVGNQITRVRAALQPPAPARLQRPRGYSFCIITGGQRREKLERQIASIRALGLPNFEILVGGDVSDVPDGVLKVDLTDAARAGRLGQMRNALAAKARFDRLIISDDDIVFDEKFGKGLERFGDGYDAMAVRVVNPDETRFWDWATTGGAKGSVLLDYWDSDPNVYITGGICVLKADTLDRVAWDDSRGFYESEDVDFSARLKAAGLVICFNPFCRVLHDDDRYSRVDRRVFRFDDLLGCVLQHHQSRQRDQARRYLAEAARLAGADPDRVRALKELAARIGEQDYPARLPAAPGPQPGTSSGCEPVTSRRGRPRTKINWIGSFLDSGSLSHVNRELTNALEAIPEFEVRRVAPAPADATSSATAWSSDAPKVATDAPADAAVTVRHAWPPDWKRPRRGKLVVIQPWEFGALPETWVRQARDVDEFWVPSRYVRNAYRESGVPARKIFVVPNGVNPHKFHPRGAPMRLATRKKFKFLFVGGTVFRKGPDLLLRAYRECFTAADDVCLVIKDFGGSSFYAGQTFESQIRAAQSEPNAPEILYLNEELSPDSMPGLYTACDCLVHPYRGEGFGLPVLEAMASGLPVIVTAGGGADDFTGDEFAYRIPATKASIGDTVSGMKLAGAGWLLEPDTRALAARMKWVIAHCEEARATGRRASEYARREWTWDRAARIAAERLHELLDQGESQTGPRGNHPERSHAALVLPPCALVGQLGPAREWLSRKTPRDAWEAARAAIGARPFHPEAWLLLAEIAQAVGDSISARRCAEHARRLAPGWKPARRFLNQRLKGNARVDWLQLPETLANDGSATERLTVCLIVRNEQDWIARCLDSVQGLADQIVVVDTGSTDRTVEIAREHGAEVHSFAWSDDFSAARNAALEHARGDWVLVLDADEELTAEGRSQVRAELRAGDVMAYRLPIVDVGREEEGCSYVPRLFRNAPGLFYVGRVHEQVFTSIEVRREEWGLGNKFSRATLLHHGYTAKMTRDRDKNARNLRLLELAIEEMPGEPNLLMNYGLELARAGNPEAALDRYREAVRALEALPEHQVVPELRESLLTQLATQLSAAKRFEELANLLRSPLAKRGGLTASLHFALGLALMELKDYREAAEQFRQCLVKRDQPALTPVNRDIRQAGPHHCLAVCRMRLGELDGAAEAFQQALAADPQSRPVRFDYAVFLTSRGLLVEALKQLHELVSEKADELPVWLLGGQIALSQPQFSEFACDWTGEGIKQFPQDRTLARQRAEALLLCDRAAEALPLWRQAGGAGDPSSRAAEIVCRLVADEPVGVVPSGDEAGLSREFLKWYRRLVRWGANGSVFKLNENVQGLRNVLPTAATALEAALSEARETVAV